MKRFRKRGFSLLELMVVVALFATCSLVVAQIFSGTVKAVSSQRERSTSEEDARMALDVISADIREAYPDGTATSAQPFGMSYTTSAALSSGTHEIHFQKRNPLYMNGISVVRYTVEGTRILREEQWSGSYVPFYVGSNIRNSDNLTFRWARRSDGNDDRSRINVALTEGSAASRGKTTAFVTEANMRSMNPMAVDEPRYIPRSEAVSPGF
ncbi:MAG: type II secretion system protein [bacterium]